MKTFRLLSIVIISLQLVFPYQFMLAEECLSTTETHIAHEGACSPVAIDLGSASRTITAGQHHQFDTAALDLGWLSLCAGKAS